MSETPSATVRSKQIHHLKCWPKYFDLVSKGLKHCEIRRNDRDYAVGDVVVLDEWDPRMVILVPRGYTGRMISGEIVTLTTPADLEDVAPGALGSGYVILGMKWEVP